MYDPLTYFLSMAFAIFFLYTLLCEKNYKMLLNWAALSAVITIYLIIVKHPTWDVWAVVFCAHAMTWWMKKKLFK